MQVIDEIFFEEYGSLDFRFDGETVGDMIKWLSNFPKDAIFCQEFDYDDVTTRVVSMRDETDEEASKRKRKKLLYKELEDCLTEIGKTIPERHNTIIHYAGADYNERLFSLDAKLDELIEKEKKLNAELLELKSEISC